MASNDYYHNTGSHNHNNYDTEYSNYDRREDAPLPALPPQQPTSPLDHSSYAYQNYHHPDTAFRGNTYEPDHYGNEHTPANGRDPFDDQEAVQMGNYNYKHASQSSTAPVITPAYDDPFVRDIDPNKNKPRWGRASTAALDGGKKGWFSGRITWVCYTLSLIQLIVFIVEIIKNGTRCLLPKNVHSSLLIPLSQQS